MIERLKPALVALLLTVGGIGVACAELPAIDANQCGNRIVDSSEDCDTFAATSTPSSSCRAPGSDGACHYDCTGTNVCPPTYNCGKVDGICRQATGTFDVASPQTLFADTNTVQFADFDGDGRADAVTFGVNDTRVHFFDGRISLAKTVVLPIAGAGFRIGALGNDTGDMTIFHAGSLEVFRGQSDRTLAPVVYNSEPIPSKVPEARAILVRNQISNTSGDPQERPTGDDIFAFASDMTGIGVVIDLAGRSPTKGDAGSTIGTNADIALPASTVDKVAGTIPVASFIEGSFCDQFAIGFLGDGNVDVYTPCRLASTTPTKTYELNTVRDSGKIRDNGYVPPTRVTLPSGATFGVSSGGLTAGAFVFDGNDDGHEDLVIAATVPASGGSTGNGTGIFIAYGVGDGTFSSSPTLSPVDDTASLFKPFKNEPMLSSVIDNMIAAGPKLTPVPLAIGDLNGDKLPDFVFPNAIYFSESLSGQLTDGGPTSGANRYLQGPSTVVGVPWPEAVIADMNHDGMLDVAAANTNGSIDFFLGNGTYAMSYQSFGLDGIPANLVSGDFDGDSTNDLAFVSTGVTSTDGGAPLANIEALFGQGATFPQPATSLGSISTVLQLTAAPLKSDYTGVTPPANANVSSMMAVTADTASNLYSAVLVGNTERLITSSFKLYVSTTEAASAIRAAAGPFSTSGENDLIVLAQSAIATDTSTYQLWLTPSTGQAQLDSTKLKEAPLPTNLGLDWNKANVAAIPITATGTSAFVLLASVLPPGGVPQLFMVDPSTLTVGAGIPITGCNYNDSTGLTVAIPDLDGDGFSDIIVTCPDSTSGKSVIQVFWGNGTMVLSAPQTLPAPPEPVLSTALFRSGPVLARTVAMLTQSGVYRSLPGGPNGRTYATATKDPALPGGAFMNTADIDGDGVADMAIVDSAKTQVQFFRGIPINDSSSVP